MWACRTRASNHGSRVLRVDGFDHDQTVSEVGLLGQKDTRESTSPQLATQEIRADFIAGFRQ